MEWLPIESAPKDGSEFLVAWRGSTKIRMARWLKAMNDLLLIGVTSTKPLNAPSYWMPLPSPPQEKSP